MSRRLVTLALASLVTLQGCSGFGVGESEYSCDGYSEGISCASAREVYKQTSSGNDPHKSHDHSDSDSDSDSEGKGEASTSQRAAARRRAGQPVQVAGENAGNRQPQSREVGQHVRIDGPTPIRTQAKVMRVWIASYEDQKGDLHVPGLVYTEVQKRRWNIGNEASSGQSRTVQPLTQSQANGNHLDTTSQPGPTQPESQQQAPASMPTQAQQ